MNTTLNIKRNIVILGVSLSLYGILVFLIKSLLINGNDTLNLAITADLLFVVPLIYFLLIRKSKIPNTTVIPVMLVGLILGSYFLEKESQTYLDLFKNWALPVIEFSILTFVIIKVRKALKTYKKLKSVTPDFYDTLKSVCSEILPKKLVLPFVTEVAVFYYGFINWKKRVINSNEFTYHKESSTPALLGGFIMVIGIETIALHFLLAKWSLIFAWILTVLSLYTAIQVLGFAKALSKRPISIESNKLFLRYGIMNETTIDLKDIDDIEVSSKDIELNKETRKLSFLGALESHNVIIRLKYENTLIGLYGLKKRFITLLLHVDSKADFVNSVKAAIENTELFKTPVKEVDEISKPLGGLLSDRQKAIRATGWILGVSWLFGFTAFSLFNSDNELAFGISTLIFSMLPAIIVIILNKLESGRWKELQFVKPKLKPSIGAFITPFIYFGIVLSIQYALEIRSVPNWGKLGSVNEMVLGLILGYPLMLFLIMGEEIAWRGYLQKKLIKTFGGLKGLIFLGLIWGIWHLPLSLQGYNLPDSPILEAFVTTPLMCIALALMIGYYGLNSKSIFIGLILHTSNNHFGGTFLYVTDVYDEFTHAMVFSIIYILTIILFSILYRKKENTSHCNFGIN
ncbi:CPBP family intramembrane glutamic endopeptidase [Crocinitomix catalasitica]|uniref:CPBP family intramembrane glutamic endopeptidase n=1 Tax=Crocinitomix catalasitica TaxID=184607 RepID=UPI000907CF29|nr:type II CAAX endopeptidase family protein [Crocinitomix catalasitica]